MTLVVAHDFDPVDAVIDAIDRSDVMLLDFDATLMRLVEEDRPPSMRVVSDG